MHRQRGTSGHLRAVPDFGSAFQGVIPTQELVAGARGSDEPRVNVGALHRLLRASPAVRVERDRLPCRPARAHLPRGNRGHFHVVPDFVPSLDIIPTQELVAFPAGRPNSPILPSNGVLHHQLVFHVGPAVRVERHRLHFRRVGPVETGGRLGVVVSGETGVGSAGVPLQVAVSIGRVVNLDCRQSREIDGPLCNGIRVVVQQLGTAAVAVGSGGILARHRIVPHALAQNRAALDLPDDGIGSAGNDVAGNGVIGKTKAPDGRAVGFVLHGAGGTVHGGHDEVIGSNHEVVRVFDQRVGLGRGVDKLRVEVVPAPVVPVVVVFGTTVLIGLGPHVQIVGLAFFQRDAERTRQVERSRVGNGEVVVAFDASGIPQPKVHIAANLAIVVVKPEVHVGAAAVVAVVPNLHLDAGNGQAGERAEIRVGSLAARGPRAVIASDASDVDARLVPTVVGECAGAHKGSRGKTSYGFQQFSHLEDLLVVYTLSSG